jgi:hypothetical protein
MDTNAMMEHDDPPLEGFDGYEVAFAFDWLTGLTIEPFKPMPWMSWDETVKFARWLTALVEAAEASRAK